MEPQGVRPRSNETISEFASRFREALSVHPFEAVLVWHGDETSPLFVPQWRSGEANDELERELLEAEPEDLPEGWHLWDLEVAGRELGRVAFLGRDPRNCEGLPDLLNDFARGLAVLLSPVLEEPGSLPELLDQVEQELQEPSPPPSTELHWTSESIYRPSKIPRSVTNRVLVDWL